MVRGQGEAILSALTDHAMKPNKEYVHSGDWGLTKTVPNKQWYNVSATVKFTASFLKDRITPHVTSQLESDVINSTYFDKLPPNKEYLGRLIAYTTNRMAMGDDRCS
eukprot:GDKK01058050.1.p1 GENE.GDKK01058050.1~~GDKK01058050.1.p1  ORF type:complete len:107 (+),score=7.46 GDKK01058050.1:74-394(+)